MNGCKPECLRTKQAWDRCFRWPYHRSSLCSAVFCCELASMQNKFWVVLVLLYLVWKSQVVKNIRKAEKSRIIFTDFFKLFESRSANSLNCGNLDDLFKLKWVHRVTESWSSLDWKGPLWGFYYYFFVLGKNHNWRLSLTQLVYSLSTGLHTCGHLPLSLEMPPQVVCSPPSIMGCIIHLYSTHMHMQVEVWLSVCGFCQGQCCTVIPFHMWQIASRAGSCSWVCHDIWPQPTLLWENHLVSCIPAHCHQNASCSSQCWLWVTSLHFA